MSQTIAGLSRYDQARVFFSKIALLTVAVHLGPD